MNNLVIIKSFLVLSLCMISFSAYGQGEINLSFGIGSVAGARVSPYESSDLGPMPFLSQMLELEGVYNLSEKVGVAGFIQVKLANKDSFSVSGQYAESIIAYTGFKIHLNLVKFGKDKNISYQLSPIFSYGRENNKWENSTHYYSSGSFGGTTSYNYTVLHAGANDRFDIFQMGLENTLKIEGKRFVFKASLVPNIDFIMNGKRTFYKNPSIEDLHKFDNFNYTNHNKYLELKFSFGFKYLTKGNRKLQSD